MGNMYDRAGLPGATEHGADADALRKHRDSIYERLESGYERIEAGLASGEDVTTWEGFWVDLLREYDRVCLELQRDLAV